MKFGIFSNGLRRNASAADSYDADLAEIVAADRLGFDEAWVSEHFGAWLPDAVPFAELLIAKAAGMTKRIRLAPAVRLLPLFHPLDVATSAAMCDHLLRGRYIFGLGSGVPFLGNMERRGYGNEQRHPMMAEAIDYILKCWTAAEPFDWGGDYWPGKNIRLVPRCYQQPHPALAVATGQDAMVKRAGESGWTLMVGQFDTAPTLGARTQAYVAAAKAARQKPDRNKITLSRQIHVSDSIAKARAEIRADVESSIAEWKRVDPGRFRGFLPPGTKVEDFDYDLAFETGLFIGGDPGYVARRLRDLYDSSGGFGTLLIVMGKDWGMPAMRKRSLKLFMREVAPSLAGLDANSVPLPREAKADAPGDASLTAAAY